LHFFLQFIELQCDVNYTLASFILECSGGLIAGFYAPCSQSHLTVLAESLPSVPGILYNTNTVDKNDLLKTETILDSCSA